MHLFTIQNKEDTNKNILNGNMKRHLRLLCLAVLQEHKGATTTKIKMADTVLCIFLIQEQLSMFKQGG